MIMKNEFTKRDVYDSPMSTLITLSTITMLCTSGDYEDYEEETEC